MAQTVPKVGESSAEKIEAYVTKLSREDALLRRIRRESDKHREKHNCDVHPSSPVTGRLLSILVRATNSKKALEVGCGLGYNAIWLARSLHPHGRLDTIEQDPLHAKLASSNFKAAGLQDQTRILRGEAGSVLSKLKGGYDFIFEDATFGEKPKHYNDLIRVLRIGGYLQFANWFPIEHAVVGGRVFKGGKRTFQHSRALRLILGVLSRKFSGTGGSPLLSFLTCGMA